MSKTIQQDGKRALGALNSYSGRGDDSHRSRARAEGPVDFFHHTMNAAEGIIDEVCTRGGRTLHDAYLRPKVKPYNAIKACQWQRDVCHVLHLPGSRPDKGVALDWEPLPSELEKH